MKFEVCSSEISSAVDAGKPSWVRRPTRRRCIVSCNARTAATPSRSWVGRTPPAASTTSASSTCGLAPDASARNAARLLDRVAQHLGPIRIGGQVVPGVLDAEGDVAGLVDPGPAHDVRGDGVGRVPLDEREVLQERALAEDGQQERCLGEVLLLEQRPQRLLRDRRRALEPAAVRERALRERLDVARLVVRPGSPGTARPR